MVAITIYCYVKPKVFYQCQLTQQTILYQSTTYVTTVMTHSQHNVNNMSQLYWSGMWQR